MAAKSKPARKKKAAKPSPNKTAKKAAKKTPAKPAPKRAKKAAARPAKKAAAKLAAKPAAKPAKKPTAPVPDLSEFPQGSVDRFTRHVCLACIFDVFTKQLRLAPRTAYAEVRRYTPKPEELMAATPTRPYFTPPEPKSHCPYCDSSDRWQTQLDMWRIGGGRSTDAARKQLDGSLPSGEGLFEWIEVKSDQKRVFFDWLDSLGRTFDLDGGRWLRDAAKAYLERRHPKTDWDEIFSETRSVRRSRRLGQEVGEDDGPQWETDQGRLFLAPRLYDEVLLVQYLVSRSHHAGGWTFEGRLVLQDLLHRLRRDHYLSEHGVGMRDPDALERLLEELSGEGSAKIYYLVDRRAFLERVRAVYERYAG